MSLLIKGVKKTWRFSGADAPVLENFQLRPGNPSGEKTYPLACSSQYEAAICFTIPTRGYCAYIYTICRHNIYIYIHTNIYIYIIYIHNNIYIYIIIIYIYIIIIINNNNNIYIYIHYIYIHVCMYLYI